MESVLMAYSGGSRLKHRPLSVAGLISSLLDPVVAIACLFLTVNLLDIDLDPGRRYWVLALITFLLTFPGSGIQVNLKLFVSEILVPWMTLMGILVLFGFAIDYLDAYDPRFLMIWAVGTPLAMFAAHKLVAYALPKLYVLGGGVRRAVVVGAGALGCELARTLKRDTSQGVQMIGFFDDRDAERLGKIEEGPLLGSLDGLAAYVNAHHVDLVFMAMPMAAQPRIIKVLDELKDTTASVYFAPDIFIADLIQARIDNIRGIPVVAIWETPLQGVNALSKRMFDVTFSALALVLISPLLLAIAIGVKLGSPGPVLFRQRRYGLDGEEIMVYKFRSMTVCEDGAQVTQATKNDQRVTPFGAFIRRTSLDELPQFINVLQGRMSVVGPRPHAVAHNEQYRKLISGYMMRHKVKPGITGWAQVNGYRGETDTIEKMRARIQYDIDYLRNWSLTFDMAIIAKTLLVAWKQKTAY
jgi:putative colanic acid biosynthesis UDP-glucose lipid carrier transferase